MRIGVVLATDSPALTLDNLVAQAQASEAAGLDMCLLRDGPWSAAAIAASLSTHTSALRLGLQLRSDAHPVNLAEELAVADQCLNGRTFAILDTADKPGNLGETLELLLAAIGGRPFRHSGDRWTVPRDQHLRVTLTPAPAQLDVPIFALGAAAAPVAASLGVPPMLRADETLDAAAATWATLEAEHPPARLRWARPALRELALGEAAHPAFDPDALVDRLRIEQRLWGLDTCVLELPASAPLETRLEAIDLLGTLVRPRLVLESLPDGVEAMWSRQVARARSVATRHDDAQHSTEGDT